MASGSSSWSSVQCPHSIGECNENCERLLDFCASNQLLASNTRFQHQLLHQAIWFRNKDCSRPGHMIDYFFVSKHFCTSVLDTCVYRSTLHDSDHELVLSTLHFQIRAKHRQVPSITKPPICPPLTELVVNLWLCPLKSLTSSLLTTLWDTFKSSIQKACEFTSCPEIQ